MAEATVVQPWDLCGSKQAWFFTASEAILLGSLGQPQI